MKITIASLRITAIRVAIFRLLFKGQRLSGRDRQRNSGASLHRFVEEGVTGGGVAVRGNQFVVVRETVCHRRDLPAGRLFVDDYYHNRLLLGLMGTLFAVRM